MKVPIIPTGYVHLIYAHVSSQLKRLKWSITILIISAVAYFFWGTTGVIVVLLFSALDFAYSLGELLTATKDFDSRITKLETNRRHDEA